MAWITLFAAGLLEIGWAIGLKESHGFTRPVPLAWTLAALIGSMALLSIAIRQLPLGTAYAVWTGIGAVGTAALGMALYGESTAAPRLVFIGLILAGIAGLRLTA